MRFCINHHRIALQNPVSLFFFRGLEAEQEENGTEQCTVSGSAVLLQGTRYDPAAKELIDICLSRTQRKTPTQVHPQYAIGRIREFYMRKVKYCQQSFRDKMTVILTGFPRLDNIHPFYSNLMNVLYDKDHYKLALGQVNSVRNVVDTIGKEYVKLLKYADSAYKCKMLKRAALGRMCTSVKKLSNVLKYLEEVRQHLSRLPGINPYAKTLLLAGHPNVGKSTFMNALSNANVEVMPFPFTTKSPYVGHFNYEFHSWQIVDTPGVLDRPLSSRNSIEMTAITALAYLQCAVLFMIDISEQCGYSIEDQVKLYHAVKELFKNKPIMVICNKVDLRKQSDLTDHELGLIKSMEEGVDNIQFTFCSTLTHLNLDHAKNQVGSHTSFSYTDFLCQACDMLIHVANTRRLMAGKSIETEERPPFIPQTLETAMGRRQTVLRQEEDECMDETLESRTLEKDLMEMFGGAGVYDIDDRKHWDLENEDWRYDKLPEFFEGKNVADFIDADIEEKLRQLELEEAEIEAHWTMEEQGPTEDWFVHQDILKTMHTERLKRQISSAAKKKRNHVIKPRMATSLEDIKARLENLGIDSAGVVSTISSRTINAPILENVDMDPSGSEEDYEKDCRPLVKASSRGRSKIMPVSKSEFSAARRSASVVRPEVANQNVQLKLQAQRKIRSMALSRRQGGVGILTRQKNLSLGRNALPNEALQRTAEHLKVLADKRYRKPGKGAPRKDQISEADRFIGTKKPKHLYSGKRGIGKTSHR